MTLRPYQQELLANVSMAVRMLAKSGRRRRIVAVMPTGAGKGTTIGAMVESAARKGRRTLVLAHRSELIHQLSSTANGWGVPHGVISAGCQVDNNWLVQVASVQTVIRRLEQMAAPDLIIVDEAHHLTVDNMWGRVVSQWPRAVLIGKTATPIRGDGRGLGEVFEHMVLGPSAAQLTEWGHLARARVFCPPVGFDVKGIRRRRGDYDTEEAGERLMVKTVMGCAVGHYEAHLRGGTAVAFCCSIRHAEATAEAFRAAGVRAASIDGRNTVEERRQLLRDLGTGALQVLTSCELIGEGVDVPSVAGCLMLRPTQSEGLHLQMIGRCLRPSAGKEAAVVLDHVGNVGRLGHHLEEREWTLDGVRRRARDGGDAVPVRECPVCFAAMAGGVPVCEECGHVFVVQTATVQTVEGQLQEVLMQRRERKREQGRAQSFEDLVAVGRSRGMKNPYGWARHVMLARWRK